MSAPMIGGERPDVFRFRLGDFEVTTFRDGGAVRPDPASRFGADQPAEAVNAVLRAYHLPTDKYENGYNVVVVNTGAQVVLFDTGNGERRRQNGVGHLRGLMSEYGPKPDEVDLVVITHCHPDHIGGLVEDGKPAFPNAKVVFGRKEFDYWMRGEGISERRMENHDLFVEVAAPLANQARFIEPDEEVLPGITAVESHGHSPGHLSFIVESAGKRMLIWGDVGNHYVLSFHNPGWLFTQDDDRQQAIATRKRMVAMAAQEGFLVSGYHMPFPGLGHVDKVGDNYRFLPVTYQLTV